MKQVRVRRFSATGRSFNVPPQAAAEMAAAGVFIQVGDEPGEPFEPGLRIMLNGQPCIILGVITREELFKRLKAAGLDDYRFHSLPAHATFWAMTTD